jgi:DNA-binding HxlR family transcriptional regulator
MVRKSSPRTIDQLVPDGFCACPVDIAFSVVGKKWTVHLIRNMLRGHSHFNEFLANIDGLSPRTLSARLKELEQEQLIVKRVARTAPVSVEYGLTEKGHAVLPILEQMVRWSVVWAPDRVFGKGKTRADIEACVQEWQDALLHPRAALVQSGLTVPNAARPASRRPLTDST